MRFACTILLVVALTLVQGTAKAQNKASVPADANSCGPDTLVFTVELDNTQPPPSDAEPGKALVFVVDNYGGPLEEVGTPTIRIGLDGSWVGANRGKSYIYLSVEPGEHKLCAAGQSDSKGLAGQRALAHFAAEAGKIYFFGLQTTNPSTGQAGLHIEPLAPQDAKYLIADADHTVFRPKK